MNKIYIDSYLDIKTQPNDSVIFCDFEFNDFNEKRPISIGLSHINQKHKFYAEFLWPEGHGSVNEWVKDNVIAHLEGNFKTEKEIQSMVKQFLQELPEGTKYFLTDSEMDLDILHKRFKNLDIKVCTFDVYFKALYYGTPSIDSEHQQKYFFHMLEESGKIDDHFEKQSIIQHHALNDANVLSYFMAKAFNENKEHHHGNIGKK